MHDGSGRITVRELSKNFGPVSAVSGLDFSVEPGSVTGFLGPNGSGKTTTLRMILGLVRPSAGSALVNGVPFGQLPNPAEVVGAALEAQGFHPSRTARNHLRCYAAAVGVRDEHVDQVLELVGLASAANRRTGGFSLGMHQRLALATALLGDPQVLVLDEPANGLDPEGIAWLRNFLKTFASTGRTVLVSSHLLREMEHTVDHAVIVSQGQSVYNGALEELRAQQRSRVLVAADDPESLVGELRGEHFEVERTEDGKLAVLEADSRRVAELALRAGVAVHGMQEDHLDLEQLFFQLTSGDYSSGGSRAESVELVEPAESPEPMQPAGSAEPSDSAESAGPAEPAEATQSAEPAASAEPAESAEPADSVEPADSAESADAPKSAESAEQVKSAASTRSSASTKQSDSSESAESQQPEPDSAWNERSEGGLGGNQ